jgi:hypothetical protein
MLDFQDHRQIVISEQTARLSEKLHQYLNSSGDWMRSYEARRTRGSLFINPFGIEASTSIGSEEDGKIHEEVSISFIVPIPPDELDASTVTLLGQSNFEIEEIDGREVFIFTHQADDHFNTSKLDAAIRAANEVASKNADKILAPLSVRAPRFLKDLIDCPHSLIVAFREINTQRSFTKNQILSLFGIQCEIDGIPRGLTQRSRIARFVVDRMLEFLTDLPNIETRRLSELLTVETKERTMGGAHYLKQSRILEGIDYDEAEPDSLDDQITIYRIRSADEIKRQIEEIR